MPFHVFSLSFISQVFYYCHYWTDTKAQDAHFSQFYSAPLLLNPALAGTIDGTFRISTVYRDQWRSALEQPLKTYTFSGDTKFEIGQTSKQSDIVGLGMTIYADRAGLFNLNTTTVTLTGAYHKGISAKNNSYLSLWFSNRDFSKEVSDMKNFHSEINSTPLMDIP